MMELSDTNLNAAVDMLSSKYPGIWHLVFPPQESFPKEPP
jgi:hypothetical protein